ncbi:hypothetical protein HCJ39_07185 [Listeria rocourtiae]|uniref:hypothetical protein n=1 Tax=Listeria rocourtiae TaxID=647910 RepID=UPI001625E03B|nr:hypothetical protein [Listeria rocourtiae]MBC1604494.1 hypothetical protein [Listeria rocourtiae]
MLMETLVLTEEENKDIANGDKKAIVRETKRVYEKGDLLILQHAIFAPMTVKVTDVAVLVGTDYVVLSFQIHLCDLCKQRLDAFLMHESDGFYYHQSCFKRVVEERMTRKQVPFYDVKRCNCGTRFIAKGSKRKQTRQCRTCAEEQTLNDFLSDYCEPL